MKVTIHETYRLRKGMIVNLSGVHHRVEMVNASRAHCVPLTKRRVEIKTRFSDDVKVFEKFQPGMDISPNAEVEIVSA